MYDTCYITNFSWRIQWCHFLFHHDYANMQYMQIFDKFTNFLHISAHLTSKITLSMLQKVTNVNPLNQGMHIDHFYYALCMKKQEKSAYLDIIGVSLYESQYLLCKLPFQCYKKLPM